MATNWWKLIVLQILITTAIGSTGLELGDDSKLSNENMISLFKQFLEDINNQHTNIKDNEKIEKIIQPLSLTSINGKYFDKFTENELKNEDLQQSTFENLQNMKSIEHFNKKSGKKNHKTNLCYFKICNKKKSIDDYDNFIRYVTKRYYNTQQF
ncbi:uncharacterized protein LOC132924137 isoform X1 [Rhopalosiphum padi]|uniref:uncharacterized protein LOC132924137 isoform X1 n=1 Tax=Rhopalosiphum padi TaxID=40932 RepID=UPI00298DBAB6|nr:uncharacterized protein LOC132924137 isoform X1 [Rhopalosiphum padi]XP_060844242.1 uncharacterized protein LOC132924137 isoform X1 [Rhopalosiphum padi]